MCKIEKVAFLCEIDEKFASTDVDALTLSSSWVIGSGVVTGHWWVNSFLGCVASIIVHHSHILNLSKKKFFDGIKM